MNNNINFTNEIQEWLQFNKNEQKDTNDSFQNIWNQLGHVVRSNCVSAKSSEHVVSSFFALTLRDFLKILPDAVPDESNFWSSILFPNYKFTTFTAIQGEQGFHKLSSNGLSSLTYIAFESECHQQPCIIESNQCKMIIFPYIQSPYLILFFLTLLNGSTLNYHCHHQPTNNNNTTTTNSSVQLTNTTTTITYQEFSKGFDNNNNNNNINEINIDVLLSQWKKEKTNVKPTIPKLAEYFNIEQDKIHKWLKSNGRSWSNMLVTYGFR
jgi:hypothetical protein